MGTFGQRLRELRNLRGISQNELSKHIGVSKSSVNMYERGEREPGFETLEAIADFFNVNMDYLLGRETMKDAISNYSPEQFSDSAKPTLAKLLKDLGREFLASDPNPSDILLQMKEEMFATFTLSDMEHFVSLLNMINIALNDELQEVERSEHTILPDASQKAHDSDTISGSDGLEEPQEGE